MAEEAQQVHEAPTEEQVQESPAEEQVAPTAAADAAEPRADDDDEANAKASSEKDINDMSPEEYEAHRAMLLERLARIEQLYGAGLWSEQGGDSDAKQESDAAGSAEEARELDSDEDDDEESARLTREILERAGADPELLGELDFQFMVQQLEKQREGGEEEEEEEEGAGEPAREDSARYRSELEELQLRKSSLEQELASLGSKLAAHSDRMKATLKYQSMLEEEEEEEEEGPEGEEEAGGGEGSRAAGSLAAEAREEQSTSGAAPEGGEEPAGGPAKHEDIEAFVNAVLKTPPGAPPAPDGATADGPTASAAMDYIEERLQYLMNMQMKLTTASHQIKGMISNLTDDFITEMQADGIDIDRSTFDPACVPKSNAELFLEDMAARGLYKPNEQFVAECPAEMEEEEVAPEEAAPVHETPVPAA